MTILGRKIPRGSAPRCSQASRSTRRLRSERFPGAVRRSWLPLASRTWATPSCWRARGPRPDRRSAVSSIRSMIVSDFERMDDTADLLSGLGRSEEHTSELQSRGHLVCRLLLEKKITFVHIDKPHGVSNQIE